MDIYSVFHTFFSSFASEQFATVLTVLSLCFSVLLGYMLIRGIISIFIRGNKRFLLSDIIVLAVLLCFVVQSFFPDIFKPHKYEIIQQAAVESEVTINE